MKIHREGYLYILIATVLLGGISWVASHFIPDSLFWLTALITFTMFLLWVWVVAFFRMPIRNMVHGEDRIIAPADGKVGELMYVPGDQVAEGAELLKMES
jgi:hypothetical protein